MCSKITRHKSPIQKIFDKGEFRTYKNRITEGPRISDSIGETISPDAKYTCKKSSNLGIGAELSICLSNVGVS